MGGPARGLPCFFYRARPRLWYDRSKRRARMIRARSRGGRMIMEESRASAFSRAAAALALAAIALELAAGASAFASPVVEVQAVQSANARAKAPWTARKSWVTELDEAGAKRLLGAPPPQLNDVEFSAPHWYSEAAVDSIDWRDKDGANWVSPVLNQGNCGSCVAFAAVATLETQLNVSSGLPWLNPRFSPQALFACGGGGCDIGWTPTPAARFLMDKGIPDEACAPYTMSASGEDVACNAVCSDAASRSTKIASYSRPSTYGGNPEAVKAALRKGPLVTTLNVYADFMAYGSGVYSHASGAFLGGHAVSIIGFDDAKRAWIIRNSWGPEWGTNGFGFVSYDDVSGVGNQTWSFEPAPASGFAAVRNLRDRDYISGAYAVELATNAPGATGSRASVLDESGRLAAEISCSGGDCQAPFDATALVDGRYEIRAESAGGPNAPVSAQPRYFYVANSKPQISVGFKPANGDLSRPLKGRVEFTVRTQSSTVPLSSIEFVALKDGKEVVRRASEAALPTMTTGWRTNLVPNGAYEIYFVGRVATNSQTASAESAHATVQVRN